MFNIDIWLAPLKFVSFDYNNIREVDVPIKSKALNMLLLGEE